MVKGRVSFLTRLRYLLVGKPRNLSDSSLFHRLSLIPFLAWVGLGADGLSSSAYGPEEAFKTLGEHKYLTVALSFVTCFTVFIISTAYRRIIEDFPRGGGGYVVASKLLGRRAGVVSGCALIVDYILTITVSIAAAGDALFSMLPVGSHDWKMTVEVGLICFLTALNIRGVKESVLVLAPIFIIFLITHALAIVLGIISHATQIPEIAESVTTGFQNGINTLGPWALFLLFIHAYSLGGGTYTGIEAVSNGLPIMREPRVETAKRTMVYMATSLAFTASGLLLCYLLWNTVPVNGKTMNAVLLSQLASNFSLGNNFVIVSLIAEGLLLVVAAQAGFIDGPRVLANMAVDSWVPRRFAALSERLTTGNGILLMGLTSLLALYYTQGDIAHLVVMYSINVFLTFSLSTFAMLRSYLMRGRKTKSRWFSGVLLFSVAFLLCATILVITIIEKFQQGGWVTLTITASLVLLCFYIKRHYRQVSEKLNILYASLEKSAQEVSQLKFEQEPMNPQAPTAAILVGGYGGLGIHTVQNIIKMFPGVYTNFIFISVGVLDSGLFKGEGAVGKLKIATETMLKKYLSHGQSHGIASTYRMAIGTDVVKEGVELCQQVSNEFARVTFFTGKIIFEEENWCQRLLHNETGFAMQKQLQRSGITMVILPAKIS